MSIELYPSVAKVKRNGVYQNLPGFVQQSGNADIEAMIANKETSTTAQYPHNKGTYFILNDVLYEADADIAVNGVIDVGINCHVAILGNDVAELKNAINSSGDSYKKIEKSLNNISKVTFFDSEGNNKIESFIVDCLYTRAGTGTPSLNNVRQISGINRINLTNNGNVIEIELKSSGTPYTVYKATVNLVTGEATIKGVLDTFTGSSVSDYGSFSGIPYVRVASSKRLSSSTISSLISNCFIRAGSGVDGSIYIPSYSSNYVRLYSSAFTSKAVAQGIMNETPIQMYYDVTPFTVQLDPNELKTLVGQNDISIDIGNFSIVYREDFQSAVHNSFSGSYGLSTDALLYVDKIPSYYIDPETTPTSFEEAQSYLDDKINTIPKNGKSFIFITDTHWDGNEKHSTYLINYIRKRTGISKVLFGGDIFGNASTKYLAVRKAGLYINQAKRAIGYDYIPCVGDHDNNTVNVTDDDTHWVPYSQTEKLFVSDLERYKYYHFYDCSEKLAKYAEVGSDDYNDAMSFFRTVYYVDDIDNKIRFIVLNCGNAGDYGCMYNIFGNTGSSLLRLQYPWLIDTLMNTPTGYDVVVLSHKGNTSYAGTSCNGLNRILSAFKRKANLTNICTYSSGVNKIESWFPYNSNYNFSNAPDVGLVFALNGHDHGDRLAKAGIASGSWISQTISSATYYYSDSLSSGDTIVQTNEPLASDCVIPIITTATDSIDSVGTYSPQMTADTVTEQCFDVITINETGIIMTRIGAGNDRVINVTRN